MGQETTDDWHGLAMGLQSFSLREFSFAEAASELSEAAPKAAVEVVLSSPSGYAATVSYGVIGGSATGGVDYSIAGSVLTFSPGETSTPKPVVAKISESLVCPVRRSVMRRLTSRLPPTATV